MGSGPGLYNPGAYGGRTAASGGLAASQAAIGGIKTYVDERKKKKGNALRLKGPSDYPDTPSFKRGGEVHRTGIYKLHAGERVVPAGKRKTRKRGRGSRR